MSNSYAKQKDFSVDPLQAEANHYKSSEEIAEIVVAFVVVLFIWYVLNRLFQKIMSVVKPLIFFIAFLIIVAKAMEKNNFEKS